MWLVVPNRVFLEGAEAMVRAALALAGDSNCSWAFVENVECILGAMARAIFKDGNAVAWWCRMRPGHPEPEANRMLVMVWNSHYKAAFDVVFWWDAVRAYEERGGCWSWEFCPMAWAYKHGQRWHWAYEFWTEYSPAGVLADMEACIG